MLCFLEGKKKAPIQLMSSNKIISEILYGSKIKERFRFYQRKKHTDFKQANIGIFIHGYLHEVSLK